GMGGWDDADDVPEAERFARVSANSGRGAVRVELFVVKFRDRIPSSARDKIQRAVENKFGTGLRTVKWLGRAALEKTHDDGVMRIVCADRHLIMVGIGGANGNRASSEEEAGFFDNFELTN